jgi:hypothetical protein
MEHIEQVLQIEDIANQLLADKSIESLSGNITIINSENLENAVDSILYQFEIFQDISMEILHQYLYLIRLIKNEEEGLECGYENIKQIEVPNNIETLNGESIEKLLQTKLKKIRVLSFIHEVPNDTNGYYTRIIFYDLCNTHQKKIFKEKKYHYLLNKDWERYITNIKNIEDVFSIFTLNNKSYILKFSIVK